MAPASREERRLMRQRGAGTRTVNNIDFDLSFPITTPARRSKTPQTARKTSNRNSKTPGRRSESHEATAPPSVPQTTISNRASKRKSVYAEPDTEEPAPATAKRRKVNNATSAITPGGQRTNASLGQSSDGLSNRPRKSMTRRQTLANSKIVPIAEESVDEGEDTSAAGPINVFHVEIPAKINLTEEGDGNKENATPGANKAQPKRRKSKSAKFSRRKQRSSTGSLPDRDAAEENGRVKASSSLNQVQPDHVFPWNQRQQKANVDRPTTSTELLSRLQQNRTRSKSVASTNNVETEIRESTSITSGKSSLRENSVCLSVLGDASGSRTKPRKRRSIAQKKKGGKRRVSNQPVTALSPVPRHDLEPEANEDETYMDEEHSPEPPTPAVVSKKAKRKPQQDRTHRSKSTNAPSASKSSRTSFPITTHRLANPYLLPTIHEESSREETPGLISAKTRSVPNPVDILAQICRETLAGLTSSDPVITAFATALNTRLFDMSAAVENRLTLEQRLRRAKKEKAEMQARYLEVRKQRETVALRVDGVRRRHWEGERRGEEAWRLSGRVEGLEGVLQREGIDEEDGDVGVEFLVESVKGEVGRMDGEGILEKVRGFNGLLERLAGVLEGRVEG